MLVVCLTPGFALSDSALARIERARTLRSQGETRRSLQAYEAVLSEIRAGGPSDLLVKVLIEATETAISTGDYRQAIADAEEAAHIANALGDGKREGFAYNRVGQAQLYQAA